MINIKKNGDYENAKEVLSSAPLDSMKVEEKTKVEEEAAKAERVVAEEAQREAGRLSAEEASRTVEWNNTLIG